MFKSYTKTLEGEVEAKRMPMETGPGQISVDYTPGDAVICSSCSAHSMNFIVNSVILAQQEKSGMQERKNQRDSERRTPELSVVPGGA